MTGGARGACEHWPLSAFYLLYFSTIGGLIPYFGPYLVHQGFTPVEIGQLLAVLMATKIVAPNVWGLIGDRLGRRLPIIRLATWVAALGFAGLFFASGFWQLALVLVVFGFFWNAALPQFEALTLTALAGRELHYARIRIWGSIGFIVSVMAAGALIDRYGIAAMPWLVAALMTGIWVSTWFVRERKGSRQAGHEDSIVRVLTRPSVLALLIACALMQASHAGYYAFFSIFVEQAGYSSVLTGFLWALGVAAEVVLFWYSHRLMRRFSLKSLFMLCFVLTAARWMLTVTYVQVLAVLLLAQASHAITFGLYHAVAIQLVHRYFAGSHQGRGQALYSSMSFGVGGALGSAIMGGIWQTGGPQVMFAASAALAILALAVVWRWLDSG